MTRPKDWELETPHFAREPLKPVELTPDSLYPPGDAVADVLSGPLEHLGTGPWHGIHRIRVCAYRNARVLVVNVYCTPREMSAFSVIVFHPERGIVRFYAEGRGPISTLAFRDYFQWTVESKPLPPPGALPARLRLSMTLGELEDFEWKRYQQNLPGCFAGHGPMSGASSPDCYRAPALRDAWRRMSWPFLGAPPPGWGDLVAALRRAAVSHGVHVDRPGG